MGRHGLASFRSGEEGKGFDSFIERWVSRGVSLKAPEPDQERLLELAARIEPDGGMPGKNDREGLRATVEALLSFLDAGHTATTGAFRAHVARLLTYVDKWLSGRPDKDSARLRDVIRLARAETNLREKVSAAELLD